MRKLDRYAVLTCAVVVVGCGPEPAATSAGSEGSTTDEPSTGATTTQPATSGPSPTSTTSTTSDSSGSSTESPTTGGATCPNGIVEDGELCDDGNTVDGDGCNNDCTGWGTLLFEHKSGLPGSQEVRDIAIDANGGIIVVGGEADLWIARFSAQLESDWSQEHDFAPSEVLLGVVASPEAIFATGAFKVPDTQIRAVWTGRFTLSGDLVSATIGGNDLGDVYSTQIARKGDGDLVIAGLMQVAADDYGVFARSFSPDGDPLWTTSHAINADHHAVYPLGPGLAVAPDAVYVGYRIVNEGVDDETLLAFPASGGAALWTRKVSDTPGSIMAIARDPGGDLILGGKGNSFTEMTTRRVTSAGDPVWSSAACIGENARDIAIDGNGDIIVIGDGTGDNDLNIRLCKFAPDGALRWARDIDRGGLDLGYAVAVLPSNQIVAGGAIQTQDNGLDGWLAVYSP